MGTTRRRRLVTAAATAAVSLVFSATPTTATPCSPNLCSGHGSCESRGYVAARQCTCNTGWLGADCSLKACPVGAAWSDIAANTDDAHNYDECSNRGTCNRASGTCACDRGFEGQACERKSCPNSCSGHGRCQSMRYYASTQDPGAGTVYKYGTGAWDADKLLGCSCDNGYWGPDCSLRHCPTGDDPLTGTDEDPDGDQYNEVQTVTCTATGGSFTLAFRQKTTAALAYDASAETVKAALQALPTLHAAAGSDSISIAFADTETEACTSSGHSWTVEFLQEFGDLPLLVAAAGKLTHSSTSVTAAATVAETVAGDKEDAYCSNRGVCDTANGVCTCEPEYGTSNGYNAAGRRGDCGHVVMSVTHCPGEVSCSGHGVCDGSPTYACACNDGWTGGDCSLLVCPSGKSWFSAPTADGEAHLALAECADAGVCDRATGECRCAAGFLGAACDRLACPGPWDAPCNGNGQCVAMAQLAEAATVNGDAAGFEYGAMPNDAVTWDFDMVQGCLCDDGFFGHDCVLRSCPKGDDPDTRGQYNARQTVTCLDSVGGGTVTLAFRQAATAALAGTATAAEVETALEALSTIRDVEVSCSEGTLCGDGTGSGGGGASYCDIEFLTELGDVPLLLATPSSGVYYANVTMSQVGTKEYDECSHKGLCDYSTGICSCFPGYGSSDGQNGRGALGDCGWLAPIAPGLVQ
ncbi:unnamed protein product, partial [Phaeothamnion confervicola]